MNEDMETQTEPSATFATLWRFSMDALAGRVIRVLTLVLSFTGVVLLMLRPDYISLAAYGLFIVATLPVWWRRESR